MTGGHLNKTLLSRQPEAAQQFLHRHPLLAFELHIQQIQPGIGRRGGEVSIYKVEDAGRGLKIHAAKMQNLGVVLVLPGLRTWQRRAAIFRLPFERLRPSGNINTTTSAVKKAGTAVQIFFFGRYPAGPYGILVNVIELLQEE